MIADDANLAAVMVSMSRAECFLRIDLVFEGFDRTRVQCMIFCRATSI
jgi:hypothetical protein